MKEAVIIFPHQLFKNHPALNKASTVFLVEEFLFFRQYKFHKQKLVLHRASMKYYESYLKEMMLNVEYIEAGNDLADIRKLIVFLHEKGIASLHICDVADDWLYRRMQRLCNAHNITLTEYVSPGFLNTKEESAKTIKQNNPYFQTAFYIQQRKQKKLLLTPDGKPLGGQWTFDKENRKKYPAKKKAPVIQFPSSSTFIKEASEYVEANFPANPGNTTPFLYPVNFIDSEKWLNDFLQTRFHEFGAYEDAIVAKEYFLNHSVLTPVLNTGLLTPGEVISAAVKFAAKENIPVNSVEGFVRQITGWREFIRIIYTLEGSKQRTTNFWGFTRKLPAGFWDGNTGIEPIDNTIKKILSTGYCHHIERLMILGNFMLLCETDPDEVYRWFMEMFIDSYDWVMVPNVYGMTQFADGGLMTTKPYISGSNYILKMSDYKKGSWCEIWDALFWRFMNKHRNFFLQNPRLGMLIKTFDNMTAEKRNRHIRIAENYLNNSCN